jgi:hypothetical protein
MSRQLVPILLGFCAVLAPALAEAQTAPQPNIAQGDGRTSPFYTWQGAIPHKPGTFLRAEPLPAELGLPNAGNQERILYASTDGIDGASPIVVSGAIFEPKGTPPKGGWPIIAWAHGTVGVADICAPSWSVRSYRDIAYLDTWLAQGYAVVATDYQGLGVPGPHPYLVVRSEAYSVLDSVRAALAHDPKLANEVVIVGQSQGGGAAFGTAGFAPRYAADVNVRGTVATGVPYFGPNVQSAGSADPTAVDPGIAYVFYLALLAQQSDPSLDAASLFTPAALPLFEVARSACIDAMEANVELARLTDATSLRPAVGAVLAKHLAQFEFPTLALAQPVFIGTGANDHDVRPAVQEQLVRDSCAAGTTVEAHRYAGLTHSETVNASLKDSLPFVRKVFAGEKPVPVCSPIPE